MSSGHMLEEISRLVDTACEVDVEGATVRSRLGIRINGAGFWPDARRQDFVQDVVRHSLEELHILRHDVSCLGREGIYPSELYRSMEGADVPITFDIDKARELEKDLVNWEKSIGLKKV